MPRGHGIFPKSAFIGRKNIISKAVFPYIIIGWWDKGINYCEKIKKYCNFDGYTFKMHG